MLRSREVPARSSNSLFLKQNHGRILTTQCFNSNILLHYFFVNRILMFRWQPYFDIHVYSRLTQLSWESSSNWECLLSATCGWWPGYELRLCWFLTGTKSTLIKNNGKTTLTTKIIRASIQSYLPLSGYRKDTSSDRVKTWALQVLIGVHFMCSDLSRAVESKIGVMLIHWAPSLKNEWIPP